MSLRVQFKWCFSWSSFDTYEDMKFDQGLTPALSKTRASHACLAAILFRHKPAEQGAAPWPKPCRWLNNSHRSCCTVYNPRRRGHGGTGRRIRLKICRREACRFDSGCPHQPSSHLLQNRPASFGSAIEWSRMLPGAMTAQPEA